MSTQGALSRARLLPTFIGVVLLVLGVVMLTGGFRLVSLGGSFYYMLCGFGFAAIGVLLIMGLRFAVWLFTLLLLISTVWALWEVGLDRRELMPRLFVWFLIGLVLLLPMARQGLKPLRRRVSITGLMIAVLLAGISVDPVGQIKQARPHYQAFLSRLIPSMDVQTDPAAQTSQAAIQTPTPGAEG
jgi:glucose dehydrogenase